MLIFAQDLLVRSFLPLVFGFHMLTNLFAGLSRLSLISQSPPHTRLSVHSSPYYIIAAVNRLCGLRFSDIIFPRACSTVLPPRNIDNTDYRLPGFPFDSLRN